jgi:TM2 domain-containing membrane protein YozV
MSNFPDPNFGSSSFGNQPDASKKIAAGVCGILLGSLGIHKFILGYKTEGLIMLLVTILTCGIAGIVFGIIGFIEGIIYLTKSDQEFINTYVVGKRGWF